LKERSPTYFPQLPAHVKQWVDGPPPIADVRPACCRRCGRAARPVGAALALIGHGVRERQLRGPLVAGGPPVELTLYVRRFLCRSCEQTMTVGPSALVPRRLYSRGAIALALALFGLVQATTPQVRRQVSTWPITAGDADAHGWPTLRRWIGAAGAIFGVPCALPKGAGLREQAARWAHLFAGHSPGDPRARAHRAFAGALRMA
jgi:hypothetical protein